MIWNSIPFMTAMELLIIAVTIYAIWRCRLIGPSQTTLGRRESALFSGTATRAYRLPAGLL